MEEEEENTIGCDVRRENTFCMDQEVREISSGYMKLKLVCNLSCCVSQFMYNVQILSTFCLHKNLLKLFKHENTHRTLTRRLNEEPKDQSPHTQMRLLMVYTYTCVLCTMV